MKRILIVSIVVLLVSLSATMTGGCRKPSTPSARPPELEIPAHFTTYSDKQGLFSISYPSDWELFPPEAELEYHVNDIISSIESDVPLEGSWTVFIAGLPATDYIPGVQIMFEPLPQEVRTHEELVEARIAAVGHWQEFRENARIKTTIDGREATIIDYEGIHSDDTGLHVLALVGMRTDKVSWGVACASPVKEFSKWEDDFHHIIRSFRILK